MGYYDDELMHYGVKGMKWGVRRARGHSGPGNYMTRKRQLEGDKRDLKTLNKGGHLSVGITKKRQAAFDARDRKALEKRIAKNEKYLADKERNKSEKKSNKKPMSTAKKVAIGAATTAAIVGGAYGAYKVSKVVKDKASSHSYKIAKEYVDSFMSTSKKYADAGMYDKSYLAFKRANEYSGKQDAITRKVKNSTIEAAKYLYKNRKYM